jgi:hypothetical protein
MIITRNRSTQPDEEAYYSFNHIYVQQENNHYITPQTKPIYSAPDIKGYRELITQRIPYSIF